ncbi:hypothetical protein Tsubulata_037590 [Turnera subulata]|uniref:Trichome birefringence-like N-terminal domain-containing protein n=1 Tax=Turnera subulata TaxID=218843 RepID=A0A9Q0F7N1_9ROSI|nr:hypothetical protein Tsubulata_037590 [Turnera subulata]
MMLETLRGKRMMYAGDSLNRGQYVSMICLLHRLIPEGKKSMETFDSLTVFTLKEYNATIEFYWAPFLLESNSDNAVIHRVSDRIVRRGSMNKHGKYWKGVDILVFNTYLWWMTGQKMKILEGSFDDEVKNIIELPTEDAYRMTMKSMLRWAKKNVNPNKTRVFFTSMSPTHTKSMDWGGKPGLNCYNETSLIEDATYWGSDSSKSIMQVIGEVFSKSKFPITFLNITQLSDYRKDAHTSIYKKQWSPLTPEQIANPVSYADCTHWCLPGLQDTWNELLFAKLFYPYFNATTMLEALRGKRMMYVGDSLNRGQYVSMVCLLQRLVPEDQKSMETFGSLTVFTLKAYNATIEFYWAPFLLESNSDDAIVHRVTDRMVRRGSINKHGKYWKGSFKDEVKNVIELSTEDAYRMAMKSMLRWARKNMNPDKTRKWEKLPFSIGKTPEGCDLFSGRWVRDELTRPLYQESECPYIQPQLTCQEHGRPDKEYQYWRWQPHGCDLPSFNATLMLETLRGKRMMYVGDSLNRGQYVSMICLLHRLIPEGQKSMETFDSLTVFTLKEYNATIEFYWAPFLLESNSDNAVIHRVSDRIVRRGSINKHGKNWKGVDILVFNTYLWWMTGLKMKILQGSFEDEAKDIVEISTEDAYRMAMKSMLRWARKNMNPKKTRKHRMGRGARAELLQ